MNGFFPSGVGTPRGRFLEVIDRGPGPAGMTNTWVSTPPSQQTDS